MGARRGAIVLERDEKDTFEEAELQRPTQRPDPLLAEIRNLAEAVKGIIKADGEDAPVETPDTPAPVEPGAQPSASTTEAAEENPRPHRILWSDEFAKLLKRGNVKVVVLSACESARRDSGAFQWTGVAPALLKAGIPVVIGMQYLISDNTAIEFSKWFYRGLSLGLNIDQSVALGRQGVMALGEDDRDQDWGVPVLYTRSTQESLNPRITPMAGRRPRGVLSPEKQREELLNQLYYEYMSEPGSAPIEVGYLPSAGA